MYENRDIVTDFDDDWDEEDLVQQVETDSGGGTTIKIAIISASLLNAENDPNGYRNYIHSPYAVLIPMLSKWTSPDIFRGHPIMQKILVKMPLEKHFNAYFPFMLPLDVRTCFPNLDINKLSNPSSLTSQDFQSFSLEETTNMLSDDEYPLNSYSHPEAFREYINSGTGITPFLISSNETGTDINNFYVAAHEVYDELGGRNDPFSNGIFASEETCRLYANATITRCVDSCKLFNIEESDIVHLRLKSSQEDIEHMTNWAIANPNLFVDDEAIMNIIGDANQDSEDIILNADGDPIPDELMDDDIVIEDDDLDIEEDDLEESYLEETYSDDELHAMIGKTYNQQKIENIYRRKKYKTAELFAHTKCTECGREKRVMLSNLVNDPKKYGSCICSDTSIDSRIDRATSLYTNAKRLRNNTSGYTGVSFVSRYKGKTYNKWRAYIEVDGKRTYLGDFTNKNDAIEARRVAGEKGVKWYRQNRNRLLKNVRKRTKKYQDSKYRDTAVGKTTAVTNNKAKD